MEVSAHQKQWAEQWWTMAKGDVGQYTELKGMEVVEFFRLLEVYYEESKQKIENAKR